MKIDEEVQQTYDHLAQKYFIARTTGKLRNRVNDFTELPGMISALPSIKGKSLLDIGCGPGLHAQAYNERGAFVTGIDSSEEMIKIAREQSLGNFLRATVYTLPFSDNSFDIGTASLMMFHLDHFDDALLEIKRVLKPEGTFLYSDLNPFYLAREFSEDDGHRKQLFGHIRIGDKIEVFGNHKGGIEEIPFLEEANVKIYRRFFGDHVRSLKKAGFQLIDYQDCFPVKGFSHIRPEADKILTKCPPYCIYVTEVLQ